MTPASTPPHEQFLALEQKIESLLRQVETLREENRLLKARGEEGLKERARLLENHNTVKNRAEAALARLKQLGHEP